MSIEIIRPDIFPDDEVRAFFTLKNDQLYSNERSIDGLNVGFNTDENPEIITKNRHHVLDEFNINPNHVAFANQVHSSGVKEVIEGGTFADTDALITRTPGLALAIQVADCAAVLIADVHSKTIAAVHAGWRGATGNIILRTMDNMCRLGADPKDCKAFISPCISLKNFEIGYEVAEQFPDQFVDYEHYRKPHLDLKAFLKQQLTETGLHKKYILVHPDCTVNKEKKYYSYRREKDKSGRMMGIIQLKAEAI
jgi:YfiH family protein